MPGVCAYATLICISYSHCLNLATVAIGCLSHNFCLDMALKTISVTLAGASCKPKRPRVDESLVGKIVKVKYDEGTAEERWWTGVVVERVAEFSYLGSSPTIEKYRNLRKKKLLFHRQTNLTVRIRPRDVMKFTRALISYIYCNLQRPTIGVF